MRKRSSGFEGYFSPAERSFTNYAANNPRSVLGSLSAPAQSARQARTATAVAQTKSVEEERAWIPDLPIAKPIGGKVVHGPAGPMRQHSLRHASFMVPSGEHEAEVLAGTNYVALDAGTDVTFATNPDGSGLIPTNLSGQPISKSGKPVSYSWAQLREFGKYGVVPRGKWTASAPRPVGYKTPDMVAWLEAPVSEMKPARKPYSMITLHHTGSRDLDGVVRLHANQIPWSERLARKIGSYADQSESFDEYADIGYHFLIDERGRIYEGRSIENVGAHVGGRNTGNLGIAVVGDHSSKPLNPEQLRSVDFLTRAMKRHLGIVPNQKGGGSLANSGFIYTHGEFDWNKRDELKGARDQLYELGKQHR
jgi:hypothetical protein